MHSRDLRPVFPLKYPDYPPLAQTRIPNQQIRGSQSPLMAQEAMIKRGILSNARTQSIGYNTPCPHSELPTQQRPPCPQIFTRPPANRSVRPHDSTSEFRKLREDIANEIKSNIPPKNFIRIA